MSTRSKNLAHELMLLVFAFAVIVVASFMTSCASLDPQAEFGLGYGWGDKYGADKGETEATPVGFTSFTIGKKYKHFNLRGGVYHWSDPATFEDFGKTSLIGTVRFGGK